MIHYKVLHIYDYAFLAAEFFKFYFSLVTGKIFRNRHIDFCNVRVDCDSVSAVTQTL